MSKSTVISIKGDVKDLEAKLKSVGKLSTDVFDDYEQGLVAVNVASKNLQKTEARHAEELKDLESQQRELLSLKAKDGKLSKEQTSQLRKVNSQLQAKKKLQAKEILDLKKIHTSLSRLNTLRKQERSELKYTASELRKEARSRRTSTSATNKQTKSMRKELAERRALGTSLVRHIRRLESLAVAYYAVTRAYQNTFGAGVELNRQYENMELGLSALISAKTKAISISGDEVTASEKFITAQQKTKDILDQIKQASLDTPASFMEMTGFYQQAIGHALASGQAFGENLDEISNNTITLTKRMSSLGSSMGMGMELINEEIRSLMSGDVSRDSKLSLVLFGSPTVANKAIKDAKKQVNGLTNLFDEMLEPFKQLEKVMTFDKQYRHVMYWIDEIRRNASKPIFDDLQDSMADLTKYLKENGEEITENILSAYETISYATETLIFTFNTMSTTLENLTPKDTNLFGDIIGDMNILETSLYGINTALIIFDSLWKNTKATFSGMTLTGDVSKDIDNLKEALTKGSDFDKATDNWDTIVEKLRVFDTEYSKLMATDFKANKTLEDAFSNLVVDTWDIQELSDQNKIVDSLYKQSTSNLDKNSKEYVKIKKMWLKTLSELNNKYIADQADLILQDSGDKKSKEDTKAEDKARKKRNDIAKQGAKFRFMLKSELWDANERYEEEALKKSLALNETYLASLREFYSNKDGFFEDEDANGNEIIPLDAWDNFNDGWTSVVTDTFVEGIQDAIDGDFDLTALSSSLSSTFGNSMMQTGINSGVTNMTNGVDFGTGNLSSMGVGLGLSILASGLQGEESSEVIEQTNLLQEIADNTASAGEATKLAMRMDLDTKYELGDTLTDGIDYTGTDMFGFTSATSGSGYGSFFGSSGNTTTVSGADFSLGYAELSNNDFTTNTQTAMGDKILADLEVWNDTQDEMNVLVGTSIVSHSKTTLFNKKTWTETIYEYEQMTEAQAKLALVMQQFGDVTYDAGVAVLESAEDSEAMMEAMMGVYSTFDDMERVQASFLGTEAEYDYESKLNDKADALAYFENRYGELYDQIGLDFANLSGENIVDYFNDDVFAQLDLSNIDIDSFDDDINYLADAMLVAKDATTELTDELNKDFNNALTGVSSSIEGIINSLTSSLSSSVYTQADFYSTLDDVKNFTGTEKELDLLLGTLSNQVGVFSNEDNFSSRADMEFAQAQALNDLNIVNDALIDATDPLEEAIISLVGVIEPLTNILGGLDASITMFNSEISSIDFGFAEVSTGDNIVDSLTNLLGGAFGDDGTLTSTIEDWIESGDVGLDVDGDGLADAFKTIADDGTIGYGVDFDADNSLDVNIVADSTGISGAITDLATETDSLVKAFDEFLKYAEDGSLFDGLDSIYNDDGDLIGGTIYTDGEVTGTISYARESRDGFASGGYTGDIGESSVAGVVHGNEYVVNARTTRDLGLNNNTGGVFKEMLLAFNQMNDTMVDIKRVQISQSAVVNRQLTTQRATLDEITTQGSV